MASELELQQAIDKYASEVRKICFIQCKSEADVDDIFQTVFIKYFERKESFIDEQHEKAWIIRVTINACHDIFRSWFYQKAVLTDDFSQFSIETKSNDGRLIEAVRKLKPNLKNAIYLYYYEGYAIKEIAEIVKANEHTVSTWLVRGRKELKKMLGGDFLEEDETA
ncbi:MAG: sigma-70 family RNA polymerase sigma factor [Anaerorhabdus sp.]|uniref:RNA polymerase sigma factor n=1 Tax=Anaerorhabdus sp. TaxID=1872524 RepID=UPI002FCB5056